MIKKNLILLIVSFLSVLGFAQEMPDFDLLKGEEQAKAIKVYLQKNQNDTLSSLVILSNKGILLAQNNKWPSYEASFKRLKGALLLAKDLPDSALVVLKNAQILCKKELLTSEIEEINGTLGNVYYKLYDLESAIECWIPTLEYYKLQSLDFLLASRFSQLGNAYLMLGETETGIKYHKEALKLDTVKSTPMLQGRIYNSLGYGFDDLNDYDSAIFYYNRAFEIGQQMKDANRMGMALINKCAVYESQGKKEDAIECLKNTISFLKDNKMENFLVRIYTTKVNLQLNTKRPIEALHSIDSIAHYLSIYPDEEIRLQIPQMKSFAFEDLGNYQRAFESLKRHMKSSDSMLALSRRAEIEDLRIRYETEKKDEQLAQTKKEANYENEKNSRTIKLWTAISISLALLTCIIILAANRRRIKRKKEAAENKVSHQLDVLKATIEGQENERKRIAKELHDGIGQQFTAIKLAYDALAEKVDTKTEKMSHLIENAAQDVRTLSHQMMPRVLQEVGVEEAIRDLVEGLKSVKCPAITFTSRNSAHRLSEKLEINIYRICQELINNSLKHANANEIHVMFYKAEDKMVLIVSDDGDGCDQKNLKGHGIMNITSRVEAMDAEYSIETHPQKGFNFTLRVPFS